MKVFLSSITRRSRYVPGLMRISRHSALLSGMESTADWIVLNCPVPSGATTTGAGSARSMTAPERPKKHRRRAEPRHVVEPAAGRHRFEIIILQRFRVWTLCWNFWRTTSAPLRAIAASPSGFDVRSRSSVRQRSVIAFADQNAAPPVLDRFRNAAMLRGEDGQPAGHRFEHRVRNAFLVSIAAPLARMQENVRLIKQFAQLRL